jgi:hypothetical protein
MAHTKKLDHLCMIHGENPSLWFFKVTTSVPLQQQKSSQTAMRVLECLKKRPNGCLARPDPPGLGV